MCLPHHHAGAHLRSKSAKHVRQRTSDAAFSWYHLAAFNFA
jgi:hypothetical protein